MQQFRFTAEIALILAAQETSLNQFANGSEYAAQLRREHLQQANEEDAPDSPGDLRLFFIYVTKIRLMKFPVCRQDLTQRTPKRTSGQLAVRQLQLTTEIALSTAAQET